MPTRLNPKQDQRSRDAIPTTQLPRALRCTRPERGDNGNGCFEPLATQRLKLTCDPTTARPPVTLGDLQQ
jgi:hypothetical protein